MRGGGTLSSIMGFFGLNPLSCMSCGTDELQNLRT